MPLLSALHIYPIKSLGGFSVTEAVVETRGLQYDRRWMLVDETGRFVSQREEAGLTGLATGIQDGFLKIFEKKHPEKCLALPLEVPLKTLTGIQVRIWDDVVDARVYPHEVNAWFSAFLGRPVRLVFMPEDGSRPADPRYAPEGVDVSLADGYPFLLIGEASLEEVNRRLETPVPMNRFRPNFVVSETQPFEEDAWTNFRIGETAFRAVKPCARCIVTTTDQETGERGAEPLKTLATFRSADRKILFGQNVILASQPGGVIRVGDWIVL